MALVIALGDGMPLREWILMPSTRKDGFNARTNWHAQIPPMGGPIGWSSVFFKTGAPLISPNWRRKINASLRASKKS